MYSENFKDCMDLLMISHCNNSHCVYIKDFNKLMYDKTTHKEKKHFCRYCLHCCRKERISIEHRKVCLKIIDKQRIKTVGKSSSVKFTNHERQLSGPFTIHPDFEAVLKEVQKLAQESNTPYTNKYQDQIPCSYT